MKQLPPKKPRPFGVVDAVALILIASIGTSIIYHRVPRFDEWLNWVVVWFIFYSVRDGYRGLISELQSQNALLVEILAQLEKAQTPKQSPGENP